MLEFLSKFEFLNKIFKLGETRQTARERLRLVLIHDRASVSPHIMESLKEDLIAIISKYLEIDISALEIGLEKRDGSIALAANIPIKRVRRIKGAEKPDSKDLVSRSLESEMIKASVRDSSHSEDSSPPLQGGSPHPVVGTEQMEQIVIKTRTARKRRATSRSKRKSKIPRLSEIKEHKTPT